MNRSDPWLLRCSTMFLDEVAAALYGGAVRVTADASCPDDVLQAATNRMAAEHWQVVMPPDAGDDRPPVEVLAEACSVQATLMSLLAPPLQDLACMIDLREVPARRIAEWDAFVDRFVQRRRAEGGTGLSLLLLTPQGENSFRDLPCVSWHGRVRKADAGLWADLHALNDRGEPLEGLVHAVAVELFGWRLDLAAEFTLAGVQDVLDPLGWLDRRPEPDLPGAIPFNGRPMACPLALNRAARTEELRNRLWRAHLSALFPWVEEWRQRMLQRHKDALSLSDLHRTTFRLSDVAELELPEIVRQIRGRSLVTRDVQEGLEALARIRKDLAHRKPAHPADVQAALRLA